MDAMTIGVDLAKSLFEVAMVPKPGASAVTRRRFTRPQFERFLQFQAPAHVVMEACGGSHHWARVAQRHGHRVSLLPAQRVRPYVAAHRKNDQADAAALLEAVRNPQIRPVAPKTIAQQELLALHRIRTQWMSTRTARINALRGFLHELGLPMARGARTAQTTAIQLLADDSGAIPARLRRALRALLDEIRALEERIREIERELAQVAAADAVIQRLQQIPGIGVLTASALVATVGHIGDFRSARHFASWIGLTPSEHSSGTRRRLGAISKAGDIYLRSLLIHGARSCLVAARQATRRARPLSWRQEWLLTLERRCGFNKATVAMANKLARTAWAVWWHGTDFSNEHRHRRQRADAGAPHSTGNAA